MGTEWSERSAVSRENLTRFYRGNVTGFSEQTIIQLMLASIMEIDGNTAADIADNLPYKTTTGALAITLSLYYRKQGIIPELFTGVIHPFDQGEDIIIARQMPNENQWAIYQNIRAICTKELAIHVVSPGSYVSLPREEVIRWRVLDYQYQSLRPLGPLASPDSNPDHR